MIYIEMDGQELKIRLYGDFEIEKYKDNYMLETDIDMTTNII